MKVLVVGAGFVGAEFAMMAAGHGADVLAIKRSPANFGDGVRIAACDIFSAGALELALRPWGGSPDVVLYALSPGRSKGGAGYSKCYVAGQRVVEQALRRLACNSYRYILLSSTSVWGVDDGRVVDEDEATCPNTEDTKFIVRGEEFALNKMRGQVVRLSGIYGPGRDRLIQLVKTRRARRYGRDIFTNRIHKEDAARALWAVVSNPIEKKTLLLSDPSFAPYDEVLGFLAEGLDMPLPEVDTTKVPQRGHKRMMPKTLIDKGFVWKYPSFREGYGAMIKK